MNTAKDRRAHPTQLKQLGRHANYATLGANLEEGDLFENNAPNAVLKPGAGRVACHTLALRGRFGDVGAR